jgi:hypothetical protein
LDQKFPQMDWQRQPRGIKLLGNPAPGLYAIYVLPLHTSLPEAAGRIWAALVTVSPATLTSVQTELEYICDNAVIEC